MNKEDILKRAQQENKGKDIADLEAQKSGAFNAYFVGVIMLIIVNLAEIIVLDRVPFGVNMAIFAMAATAFITKFVKRKKRHELIVALIYTLGAVIWAVCWVLQLRGRIG